MADSMKEEGVMVVVEPQWFSVLKTKGPLADGEESKARLSAR